MLGAISFEGVPMPNRRPDPARERLWQKRLARWRASGLKVCDFCEREGVTPTAFAHWRKEIAARDAHRGASQLRLQDRQRLLLATLLLLALHPCLGGRQGSQQKTRGLAERPLEVGV